MAEQKKINLLDLNRDAMRELFVSFGEKPFRGDQVMKWIYHFGVDNFDEMSNVTKSLKKSLKLNVKLSLQKYQCVNRPVTALSNMH